MSKPFIKINDIEFPAPDRGLDLIVATNVSAGRNAKGEFVGQKVGRDQYKIDNLQWSMLSAEDWSKMLKEFDKFVVTGTFPDPVNNNWITIRIYPGNRTASEPVEWYEDGRPKRYKTCKVNLIDCGVN